MSSSGISIAPVGRCNLPALPDAFAPNPHGSILLRLTEPDRFRFCLASSRKLGEPMCFCLLDLCRQKLTAWTVFVPPLLL